MNNKKTRTISYTEKINTIQKMMVRRYLSDRPLDPFFLLFPNDKIIMLFPQGILWKIEFFMSEVELIPNIEEFKKFKKIDTIKAIKNNTMFGYNKDRNKILVNKELDVAMFYLYDNITTFKNQIRLYRNDMLTFIKNPMYKPSNTIPIIVYA